MIVQSSYRSWGVAGALVLLITLGLLGRGWGNEPGEGTLLWRVADGQGKAVACQIYMKDDQQRPVRPVGAPFWHDHFSMNGSFEMILPEGTYTYQVERGPEFLPARNTIVITAGKQLVVDVELSRLCDLRSRGWFSGDLHIHRPPSEIDLLLAASDLDLGPVITWWNATNSWENVPIPEEVRRKSKESRWFDWMAGEDEREGGALLYFGLKKPMDLSAEGREFPSPMHFVDNARFEDPGVWIDIEKPFWWDVPTWVATGKMDSIGLAHNHMHREGVLGNEAWGRARDMDRLPAPLGNGYWSQEIYYHLLNAGIRIPPSAGSASGVLQNPVGYNRVYVQLDGEMTWDAWFQGLKAGRCFVTNGPLLEAKVNGQLPGASLPLLDDGPNEFHLQGVLHSAQPIQELEVIYRGGVIRRIPGSGKRTQEIDEVLKLNDPGWLLVRAFSNKDDTFRFASTAPWWIERPGVETPISAESCRFFLQWLEDRTRNIRKNLPSPSQLTQVLEPHIQARRFWSTRLQTALEQETTVFPKVESSSNRSRIRVMSFNILQGGGDASNVGFDNKDYGGSRVDEIAAAILASGADIVGIQEGGPPQLLLKHLGAEWKNTGSVYSKHRMTLMKSSSWLSVVRVHLSDDKSVIVANCHWAPSPYGPFLVQEQIRTDGLLTPLNAFREVILEKSRKKSGPRGYLATVDEIQTWLDRGEVVVLTGDFNEPSHLDWTLRAAQNGADRWVRNPTSVPLRFDVPWEGSLMLQGIGLRDAYRDVFPNEVLRPGDTWTPMYADGSPGRRPYGEQVLDRIDRIYFGGSGLRAVDAAVIGGNLSTGLLGTQGRWPSDHAAVVVEFDEQIEGR
jgi:endonuclease/exonuclease/phosphatase family metal-dependent hydrolase